MTQAETVYKNSFTVEYSEREIVYDGYSVAEEIVIMNRHDFERLLDMVREVKE